jgi:ElaB/YqjD/DUF883 family membrane-anchored ribosome-binding protein
MKNTALVKEDAQRLLTDLRALGLEAEKLIENSASEMTDNALIRLRQQFGAATERFNELYGIARERTIAGAKYTDEIVRANPYRTVGVAAGIGLLAGFLIGRSSNSD